LLTLAARTKRWDDWEIRREAVMCVYGIRMDI
jgi:hypothetical protein